MAKKVHTKETYILYAMIGFFQFAKNYAEYLIANNGVVYGDKANLKNVLSGIKRFIDDLFRGIPKEDRKTWDKDWTDRDFMSGAAIFECWADFDDPQRDALEEFALQLKSGDIKIEKDYCSPANESPVMGENCLIITKSKLVFEATFHGKTGFFIGGATQKYIKIDEVLLWKPVNVDEILKQHEV